MITIRAANDRGHANFGWLDSYHSFSFGNYYDPNHMGFRALRVINEDWIAPGQGFPTHPHRDMEILTYVLSGSLSHRDSMGNSATVKANEIQRMTAGTGITHSEYSDAESETHLLQIWILPDTNGLTPSYEEAVFPIETRQGNWRLLASRKGGEGAVMLHQDVDLYATALSAGGQQPFSLRPGRHAWLQVKQGKISLNGLSLEAGDGAAISQETQLDIQAHSDAELLLFDLA
jgi:quercetin 2,3-dioxygenase